MNVGVCGAGIFALLDCLPGMAFTLTLFRKRLRLGVRATVAVCALLVVIQVVAGSLRYRHVDDNAYMALMAILLPVLWGFPVIGLIRDSWRKIVFVLMLFMNLSGTVTVMGNAVDRHLFPGGGVYDWRYLLTVLLVGIALICVLFVSSEERCWICSMLRMRIISGGTCGWFRLDSAPSHCGCDSARLNLNTSALRSRLIL